MTNSLEDLIIMFLGRYFPNTNARKSIRGTEDSYFRIVSFRIKIKRTAHCSFFQVPMTSSENHVAPPSFLNQKFPPLKRWWLILFRIFLLVLGLQTRSKRRNVSIKLTLKSERNFLIFLENCHKITFGNSNICIFSKFANVTLSFLSSPDRLPSSESEDVLTDSPAQSVSELWSNITWKTTILAVAGVKGC